MKRLGICQKCGEEKIVQDHHYKGYYTDEVAPFCQSCDQKAHFRARKEGRCNLTKDEIRRFSTVSSYKRSIKNFILSTETVEPFIQLREQLQLNLNTGHIYINSYFAGNHGKKIKFIDEK